MQVLHGMKTDDPSYVFKVDAASGKTLWKVERPTNAIRESPDSYTTPALLQYQGKTEIVITGGDVVTGHDPATGKELWRADGLNPQNNPNFRIVASPIIAGDLIIAPDTRTTARWPSGPVARATSLVRTSHGNLSSAGPTCPHRSATAPTCTS